MKVLKVSVLFLVMSIAVGTSQAKTLCNNDSSHLRPVVLKIVEAISRKDILESAFIGEASMKSDQWERYQDLCHTATIQKLTTLTEQSNAVVRCYAFQAIAFKKDTSVIFKLLLAHLTDTSIVSTMSSDLGGREMVGDYFIEVVTPNYIDLNVYKLSCTQRSILDSIVLYNRNIKLSYLYSMLRTLRPALKYYSRIRELVVTENNLVALLALSRYRNFRDTSIISAYLQKTNRLYYPVYSVREFPNATFYPAIVKIFENEWQQKAYDYRLWRILYQALAQYPTAKTLELFEKTVQSKDEFRYQTLGVYLTIALTRYPNPLFKKLKSEIKLDSNHTEEVTHELSSEE